MKNFYGPIIPGYDISENTTIGQKLYEIASREDVVNFLETGTQIGGSARCISTGLKDTNGHLHTFEAIEDRVNQSRANLEGLPVTVHWASTLNETGLRGYYNQHVNGIKPADGSFEKLLDEITFDAVFLDSCVVSQQYELETVIEKQHPVHILMHEPNAKCPDYESYMLTCGYELVDTGTDEINGHHPLWTYHRKQS